MAASACSCRKGKAKSEGHDAQPCFSRCMRCSAGCIHLTCGNVTLTLTTTEFLVLAESIGAMRHQLREEVRSSRESRQVEATFSTFESNAPCQSLCYTFPPLFAILVNTELWAGFNNGRRETRSLPQPPPGRAP